MIQSMHLRFGSKGRATPLKLDVSPITVFVGPNNAGKSRAITEIDRFCRTLAASSKDAIVQKLEFVPRTAAEIEQDIISLRQDPRGNESVAAGHVLLGRTNAAGNFQRIDVDKTALFASAANPSTDGGAYAQMLGLLTLKLDGTNRLSLLNGQTAGDLQTAPQNLLAVLFSRNDLRERVREIMHGAFGKYFVIDPTHMGRLRVRLAERPPADEAEERGWAERSVRFHSDAVEITSASDGVRAFGGIVTSVLAGEPKITLIDEPEAFLHPALAARLAKELGRLVSGTNKRIFVSTHSSSFLLGCIQSRSPVSIVRLTYNFGEPTARVLPETELLHLVRHPLLRSVGVLSGLFYDAVVVAEADSDRAFYQEVNERLLDAGDPRGIANCLFLNAQNKQTVWDIVKPLRRLGIPTAAIVDIDVLKDGGKEWTKVLSSACFPEPQHSAMQDQRSKACKALVDSGRDMKKDGGVGLLVGDQRAACENLLQQLREYGVFIVPGGELESWLKPFCVSGHGPPWLIEMFQRLGEDPNDSAYVRPGPGDVWDFISGVCHWLQSANRKGIPE